MARKAKEYVTIKIKNQPAIRLIKYINLFSHNKKPELFNSFMINIIKKIQVKTRTKILVLEL